MDSDAIQERAILFAGQMAGEYLDEIKKYDLSALTKEQWYGLIEVICYNYDVKNKE